MPTPNLDLPYLVASQANKEAMHNQALIRLDALVQSVVVDKDLTAPPGSPTDGATYIPAATATGVWAGLENYVVTWFDELGLWVSVAPNEGWRVWVADEDLYYQYTGSLWGPDLVSSEDGITASVTQTQVGSRALTKRMNRISTCANANDAVGLPTAIAGRTCGILNSGAQAAGVWPKTTGNAIDGGAANAVDANTLPAGSYREYHCFTTGTWRTLHTDA
jgi:hypothetical protein